MKRVLIIDDDKKLNDLLTKYLSRYNYNILSVTDPEKGLKVLRQTPPDIIILDIMLPGMDGFEVCRQIRRDYSIPIIMLTARGDVSDRVVGLELGADDYLPKPFEPRELVARMNSVLRRVNDIKTDVVRYGPFFVDYHRQLATLDNNELDLTTMEFEILSLFISNPGIVLDRDQIFEKIKGLDNDSFDRSIDVLVSRLRSKLNDDSKNPKFIKTIWGRGYKFIAKESNNV